MTTTNSVPRPIRVALADDHPLIASALTKLLNDSLNARVAHVSHSGPELLRHLRDDPCELVITDLNMGANDGIDDGLKLIKTLRDTWKSTRIIVFTALNHPALVRRVLQLGAQAVVSKEDPLNDLFAAIHSVASHGDTYLSSRLRETEQTNAPQFTPRELEVMRCIGLGMSVVDISRRMFVTVSTVSTHKRNVMNKLGVRSTVELIQYIHAAGLANLRWGAAEPTPAPMSSTPMSMK